MPAADTIPAEASTQSKATATTAVAVTTEDFVRAFNKQRTTLAGFARCKNKHELDIVRDGFYLGLAKDLCPDAYKAVLVMVLRQKFGNSNNNNSSSTNQKNKNNGIVVEEGDQGMLSMSFEEMVLAARICDDTRDTKDKTTAADADADVPTSTTTYWKDLVEIVLKTGSSVGSDLESIWKTLEDGRLSWLAAVSAAHPIKGVLKKALQDDGALDSPGDVSDAMMVWIYSLCLALTEATTNESDNDADAELSTTSDPQLTIAVDKWATAVNMTSKDHPLKGYKPDLWDPRRDEWAALDLGAQEAAERGGANLLEAWNA